MNTIHEKPSIEEKILVSTLITAKPAKKAFMLATLTVMIMVLITFFYWKAPLYWSELLPAVRRQVFENHQWWRIYTSIFIHADSAHFISNMFLLWIFSYFVFGYFGFTIYPLLAYFFAGVVNALAILTYSPDVELLGASGLVCDSPSRARLLDLAHRTYYLESFLYDAHDRSALAFQSDGDPAAILAQ